MKTLLAAILLLALAACSRAPVADGGAGLVQPSVDGPDIEAAKAVLAEQLGVELRNIHADMSLREILSTVDELDVVEIVMAMEERFQVEITDEQLIRHVGSNDFDAEVAKLTAREFVEMVYESRAR